MAEEATALMSIVKLNGENYRNWAFRIKNSLKYKRLWKCVEAEKVTDPGDDDQALSIISLACNDIVKDLIIDCKSAREAWNILEEKFVRKTPAAKVGLYCALTSLQCTNLAGVRDLLDEFSVIVRKLQELKVTMDNDMYSIVLLRALPASFEQFKVAILTRDALPELEEVKTKVEEERLRQLQNQPPAPAVADTEDVQMALAVNTQNMKCFKCHQRGHLAWECRKKQGNINRGNGRRYHGGDRYDKGKFAMYASVLATSQTTANKPGVRDPEEWLIDSACSVHVCTQRDQFKNIRIYKEDVILPNGSPMTASGIGVVELETPHCVLELRDVRYIPNFIANIFSASTADRRGCHTTLGNGKAVVRSGSRILADGFLDETDQYVMRLCRSSGDRSLSGQRQQRDREPNLCGNINAVRNRSSLLDWHRRLGHLNMDSIIKMSSRGLVEGLDLNTTRKIPCEVCARAKISTEAHPKETRHRAKALLRRIHSDVCEMPSPSVSGKKYFVTFIDDFSRYVRVFCIEKKSEVIDCWLKYKALVENQVGTRIKALRSDNGGEYVNGEFLAELNRSGIEHETSVPESPPQNGVAERMNRTLVEMVRCMLLDGEMPEALWAEALQTAVYTRNRSESSSTDVTPFELMYGRKPTMGHMQRFGARVVVMKRRRDLQKLQPKGDVMRFCGYAPAQKGYRVVNEEGRLIVSRNCRFLDTDVGAVHLEEPEMQPNEVMEHKETSAEEEPEEFKDAVDEQPVQQRRQPARVVKVPRNYKDVSSDDEKW